MVDLLIGAVIIASLFTGYIRGPARELIELVAMLAAIPIAFRAGPTVAGAFTDLPEANAGLLGGIVVLTLVTGIAGLSARLAERRGLLNSPQPAERIAGSLIGLARSTALLWVVITALAGAPATVFASITADSAIASAMTGDLAVRTFSSLTGNEDVPDFVDFNRRYPDGPLVGDGVYQLPAFPPDRLTAEPNLAARMVTLINVERSEAGLGTLQWSPALAEVAEAYAFEMYQDGFFAHESSRTGSVGDRVQVARISYRVVGENLALAPTLAGAHQGLMNSPGHRANILGPYTSVGIGAARGPLGLIFVQVFRA